MVTLKNGIPERNLNEPCPPPPHHFFLFYMPPQLFHPYPLHVKRQMKAEKMILHTLFLLFGPSRGCRAARRVGPGFPPKHAPGGTLRVCFFPHTPQHIPLHIHTHGAPTADQKVDALPVFTSIAPPRVVLCKRRVETLFRPHTRSRCLTARDPPPTPPPHVPPPSPTHGAPNESRQSRSPAPVRIV